jgi:GNAT superfamily N-acetyltransferase
VEGVTAVPYSPPVPIDASYDLSDFSCGNGALDDWLRTVALKAEGRSARTYVVCEGTAVVGYYCLATGSVARPKAPGNVRRNAPDPIPVMIVGRLAVTERCKGQGIGSGMLRDAFRRIIQAAGIVGFGAVLVHAIDEPAAEFYVRHGFIEFPVGTRIMFLPLETLRRAL